MQPLDKKQNKAKPSMTFLQAEHQGSNRDKNILGFPAVVMSPSERHLSPPSHQLPPAPECLRYLPASGHLHKVLGTTYLHLHPSTLSLLHPVLHLAGSCFVSQFKCDFLKETFSDPIPDYIPV